MFASFHSKGTIPSCSDMLNMCASGVQICCTVSFSILGAIPSIPGDLFSFILLLLLATTSGVTTNCPNLSPSDPSNFVSGTVYAAWLNASQRSQIDAGMIRAVRG